jgi:hypothetical protein
VYVLAPPAGEWRQASCRMLWGLTKAMPPPPWLPGLALAWAFWNLPGSVLNAQSMIRGKVRSDSSDQTVAGAEIRLPVLHRAARSGSDGYYRVDEVPPGRYRVDVRAIGFQPLSTELSVGPRDTLEVDFELIRVVQQLEPLRVDAKEPTRVSAKMQEFEERRKRGFGKFLTRDWLAEREYSVLTNVLRMTPGLSLVRRPFLCGGGFAVTTGRGGAVNQQEWMRCETPETVRFPLACYLAIYLDGMRIWVPGQVEPPDIDKIATIVSLEGIELYRGPSEAPAEFQGTGNACGAVLLWTRTGER